MKKAVLQFYRWRFYALLLLFLVLAFVLLGRVVYLIIFEHHFLVAQGNSRSLRAVDVPAYRGMIVDRNGEPLAVSTPLDSIWINPQDFSNTAIDRAKLAKLLSLSSADIQSIASHNKKREFAYLKRGISPALSLEVKQLAIPGVYIEQAYQRYYPTGEVLANILGITNVDDQGQEGLELAFDHTLRGIPGKQKVLKDRYGNIVAVLSDLAPAQSGQDITLSIDSRIQYLTYRALKETVQKYRAASGSAIVLDPKTGEILAMANQPSFNPNQRPVTNIGDMRNRAVTDMFEPGSTMKAFSILSALDSGKYTPDTLVDTNPGYLKLGRNTVYDDKHENHGVLTVTGVLQKSSNIGVAKIVTSLPSDHFLSVLHRVGFGEKVDNEFPGESPGVLSDRLNWSPFMLATLGFGYGITVTALQLAQAYGVIANQGLRCPVTVLMRSEPGQCQRELDAKNANAMLSMLESVLRPGGTGTQAQVGNYRVAGKTGTAYIAGPHGYDKSRLTASFVGIAPVSNPRLVVAVIIREPKRIYYGGVVAAPAFARIMSGALRILNVLPDAPIQSNTNMVNQMHVQED